MYTCLRLCLWPLECTVSSVNSIQKRKTNSICSLKKKWQLSCASISVEPKMYELEIVIYRNLCYIKRSCTHIQLSTEFSFNYWEAIWIYSYLIICNSIQSQFWIGFFKNNGDCFDKFSRQLKVVKCFLVSVAFILLAFLNRVHISKTHAHKIVFETIVFYCYICGTHTTPKL